MRIEITPAPNAQQVSPDAQVKVAGIGGPLGEVRVTDGQGAPLDGAFSPDHATWTSTVPVKTAADRDLRSTGRRPRHGAEGAAREDDAAGKVWTNQAIDAPEHYRLKSKDAMRITNSGEFVHDAPWNTGPSGPQETPTSISDGASGQSKAGPQKLASRPSMT